MWSSRRTLTPRAGKRCAWFLRAGSSSGGGGTIGLVVDLHVVAVGGGEGVGRPWPRSPSVQPLPRPDASMIVDAVAQRLRARRAVGEVAQAGDLRRR